MEKFIEYEKLSKKKQKEINSQKRGEWNINPVTKVVSEKVKYSRKLKHKKGFNNYDSFETFFYII